MTITITIEVPAVTVCIPSPTRAGQFDLVQHPEPNQTEVHDDITQALKPFLDKHHTSAKVAIEVPTTTYRIEGAWNG